MSARVKVRVCDGVGFERRGGLWWLFVRARAMAAGEMSRPWRVRGVVGWVVRRVWRRRTGGVSCLVMKRGALGGVWEEDSVSGANTASRTTKRGITADLTYAGCSLCRCRDRGWSGRRARAGLGRGGWRRAGCRLLSRVLGCQIVRVSLS